MRTFAPLAAVLGLLTTQAHAADQADRAAAIKEGNVNWYTSTPFPLVQQLADRFTADTGIKVTLLRSGGEAVLRRFLQEQQAGQPGADVITMSDAGAATGLARKGVFVPFKPDGFDKVVDGAKDKDGAWIAQRVHLIGMPVRTDLMAESDRPKTWSDLKDGKFKGKMVMPDPSFTAIQLTVVGAVAEARLGLLQGAARERHDDRARPSAGLQNHAAGRTRARRRGLRPAQLQ
jgi:iron(III) transport system substrate-binding protein